MSTFDDPVWYDPLWSEALQKYTADLQRQLDEARARVKAMERAIKAVRLAMFRTHSGKYDILRTHAKAIGEALAALPEPPKEDKT